jgi:cobalt-zinc-cadmium efflux system outer membrane protein
MKLRSHVQTLILGLLLLLAMPKPLSCQSADPEQDRAGTSKQQPGHQHPPSGPTQSRPSPSTVANSTPVGERILLEDLERMALEKNPTLAQASAIVRAAEGRQQQAGLYPNPIIGVTGDENNGGPVFRGGEFGAFVEQRIVRGRKLKLSGRVLKQEVAQAEVVSRAQKIRVLNSVRTAYYEALGAQQRVEKQTQLTLLSRRAVNISKELANVGIADQPDVLAAEIEAERSDVNFSIAKTARQQTWEVLAAVVGNPSLPMASLAGNLEDVPRLELENVMVTLLNESPEVRGSEVAIAREEAAVRRAQAEKIPDILARGGVRYNRELLEIGGRPVGFEGFFDVGFEIPFFNRNQGRIQTARAHLELATREVDRVKLSLRTRMTKAYKTYQDSLTLTERYRTQMIPRARKAYSLYMDNYRQMAAAYPQVIAAQKNLFQLEADYIDALVNTWRSVVAIKGLLLSGGLERPGLMGMEVSAVQSVDEDN